MFLIAQGLSFRPGDRILTTDHEHPAGRMGWDWVARRYGVEVDALAISPGERDPETIVGQFAAAIRPETRISVLLAHPVHDRRQAACRRTLRIGTRTRLPCDRRRRTIGRSHAGRRQGDGLSRLCGQRSQMAHGTEGNRAPLPRSGNGRTARRPAASGRAACQFGLNRDRQHRRNAWARCCDRLCPGARSRIDRSAQHVASAGTSRCARRIAGNHDSGAA